MCAQCAIILVALFATQQLWSRHARLFLGTQIAPFVDVVGASAGAAAAAF